MWSLIERARKNVGEKLLYFSYGGNLSMSANIANQLMYEFPDKIVVVVYIKGDVANISLRGKNVRKLTMEIVKDIEGATGGGHNDATGAKMNVDDLDNFRKKVEEWIE